ncbi:hypothetical protein SSP24_67820 [Streptomyces spinoverrucosus]|uniref:Uncharacterized protein n=1 Tax=Streptomyces spinoverrucosus TaxID=284043 RepID=A0A4Y3VQI8_9ACTN|nr:hypothetical protein SSP24_67820 [Streptomyces spinoverrucosus]GHB67281.1 hypothetical protein GCM10010397_41750 [Streptomyces spinoverrucosus]
MTHWGSAPDSAGDSVPRTPDRAPPPRPHPTRLSKKWPPLGLRPRPRRGLRPLDPWLPLPPSPDGFQPTQQTEPTPSPTNTVGPNASARPAFEDEAVQAEAGGWGRQPPEGVAPAPGAGQAPGD